MTTLPSTQFLEGKPTIRQNRFTDHQKHIQQILAVTFSSISIVSACLTFYWFMKLRKVFRHQLIIFLIASDLSKAIWYFAPAVTVLASGRPPSKRFCYGYGFMLTASIEASDFIILLIAAHTALSVLRPGKSEGLYSHRWSAYACWISFFSLLPGIAFVNKQEPYVSQGTYCYLPIRPFWYRIALGWVPRYIILATIITTYLTIYIYTKKKFGKFHTKIHTSSIAGRAALLDETKDEARSPRLLFWRRWSGRHQHNLTASERQPIPMMSNEVTQADATSSEESTLDPSPIVTRKQTLLEALRDHTLFPTQAPKDANSAVRKRHRAIQRQLRYMFIYPLVYTIMWTPMFINHCFYYTKDYNPPFPLNCVALTCVSLHCAVDCLIFNLRELPWRAGRKRGTNDPRSVDHGSAAAVAQVRDGSRAAEATDDSATQDLRQSVEGQTTQRPRPERLERHWWDNEAM